MNADSERIRSVANRIRQDVITMLAAAGSGHAGGSLGIADVLATLYFGVLRHRPHEPSWPDRDRVVLSNGHVCPAWYATLAAAGYLPHHELSTLRALGSRLQGHPHRGALPGVETTGGPLGQGLSQACGLALAARLSGVPGRTYALLSDGEHDEGQTWEAVLFAAKEHLSNLTAVVDRNGIQIDGRTEDILPLEPLGGKYRAFGWRVLAVDGHDIPALLRAFARAAEPDDRPTVIIARTVPGKGVDFMENDYRWHGKAPNAEEAARALDQLRSEARR